jgi:chromosome segregation ATPase
MTPPALAPLLATVYLWIAPLMAQPPGKRNSSIHLLSGGEKALTAIALVFSLFQLNPAPFPEF